LVQGGCKRIASGIKKPRSDKYLAGLFHNRSLLLRRGMDTLMSSLWPQLRLPGAVLFYWLTLAKG
jgi:hypothetical protein